MPDQRELRAARNASSTDVAGRPIAVSSAGPVTSNSPFLDAVNMVSMNSATGRGQPARRHPLLVVHDDALDAPAGDAGDDGGDVGEVQRVRGGQWRGDAVERAVLGQGEGGGLGQVVVGGPRHRAVLRHGECAGLEGRLDVGVEGGGVEAVAQGGEGDVLPLEVLLGGRVHLLRREERAGGGGLVAGVEDAPHARGAGGVDGGEVGGRGGVAADGGGDHQDALGALERVLKGGGVGEVARPDAYAPRGQAGGLAHVPHAHPDPFRGYALQQAVDDLRPEAAGGSRDDQHGGTPVLAVSSGTRTTLTLIFPLATTVVRISSLAWRRPSSGETSPATAS
ncbi:hypothetical protein GCM10020001_099750 [Nonomuraea salmonea]